MMADLAVAMLIMQRREIEQAGRWLRAGHWAEQGPYPLARKVSGRRVGIVGLGRIGREIANRLAAFKMEIHYVARSEKETPGWTLHADPLSLAQAVDTLVVALVGGGETRGFVSREVIEALGPQGVVIDVLRVSTMGEAALIEALETGAIVGGRAGRVHERAPDRPAPYGIGERGAATAPGDRGRMKPGRRWQSCSAATRRRFTPAGVDFAGKLNQRS